MTVKMIGNTMYALPNQGVVIVTFRAMVSWSRLRAAGKSPLLPLLPNSAFTDIMINLKLATVVVAFTPWKSAKAMNLDSYFLQKCGC